MAMLIEADTRLDAWAKAADYLLEYGPTLNLTLAIESPTTGGANGRIDQFLADEQQFPMHTVAETIFPGVEYRQRGLRGVLDFYPEVIYPAIKKHPSIRWGYLRLSPGPAANRERQAHQSLAADDREDAKRDYQIWTEEVLLRDRRRRRRIRHASPQSGRRRRAPHGRSLSFAPVLQTLRRRSPPDRLLPES